MLRAKFMKLHIPVRGLIEPITKRTNHTIGSRAMLVYCS